MRTLRKLLLINWYSYSKEIISFEKINFLTGKTAAGKSTVIDALQLVLLGNTNGNFFNKAANEKSERSLKGYLFGEKGDDGDTGFSYLRNENFTSYVICEFSDDEKNKPFLLGIVCDCRSDQTFIYKWIRVSNHALPEDCFIGDDRIPVSIGRLPAYLRRWAGKSDFQLFDNNKSYREEMLARFGNVKPKYLTLLKKAVPFSPISDIEKFITESICDISSEVDIEHMQNDIRQYKNLEKDMQNLERKIKRLQEISDSGKNYAAEKEKLNQQDYIILRSRKEGFLSEQKKLQEEEAGKTGEIADKTAAAEKCRTVMKEIGEACSKLEQEYYSLDIVKKGNNLEEQIKALTEKADTLEKEVLLALDRLHAHGRDLDSTCRLLGDTGIFADQDLDRWKAPARIMMIMNRKDSEKASIKDLAAVFMEARQETERKQYALQQEEKGLEKQKTELEEKIRNLKKGIKPYPRNVQILKNVLEKSVSKVSILSELLEIQNPQWRNAVEGYLDKQKFYLLVPAAEYGKALHLYDRIKRTEEVSGAGLVDLEKLKNRESISARKGSLAEQVMTDDPDARIYVDYLLGNVVCCDTVDQLRGHQTAITKECMLYKGYVARQIEKYRYEQPYIGRNSLQLLMNSAEEELESVAERLDETKKISLTIKRVLEKERFDEYEAQAHEDYFKRGRQEAEIREKLKEVLAEYDSLDFTYSEKVKNQIKEKKKQSEENKLVERALELEAEHLKAQREVILQEKLPGVLENIHQSENEIREKYEAVWIARTAEPRFLLELKKKNGRADLLIPGFISARAQTDKHIEEIKSTRTRLRSDYNRDFIMSYDINALTNDAYEKDLQEYEAIELPKYKKEIEDSQRRAYRQFRDDFLAKIKSNIQTVEQQIKELNNSLKKSVFGTDSYRFTVSPRADYKLMYDMFMDPMLMDTKGDYNLFSDQFETKYREEIKMLFQQLIVDDQNLTAEKRNEYEKSIHKWTDYKTYLTFDLIVTNDRGEEQKLSKTLKKKSGGETQIPFYISLLASFSQVCRIRNANANNTIRIIILDEAFSKMDGERIKESIRLLRKFGLQAIFSAPPEKIPDIAPLVDRNIAVYKNGDVSFTRAFDAREIDEELMSEA